MPGVAVAAGGSLVLQSAGGWYVDHAVNRASDTYGTFAVVIGLMSWFFLLAHLVLLAAEVNVVRARRLWPRSLTGALGPADRAALRTSAEAARRDPRRRRRAGGACFPACTLDRLIALHAARSQDWP